MSAARFKSTSWWKYQDIKNNLATELKLHMIGNPTGGRIVVTDKWVKKSMPSTNLLCLTAKFYRTSNRISDIDNLLKMAMDILQTAGVMHNDDQIREVHATVKKSADKGRFELEINPI